MHSEEYFHSEAHAMNLNDHFNAAATVSAEDSCHLHWPYMGTKICIFFPRLLNSELSKRLFRDHFTHILLLLLHCVQLKFACILFSALLLPTHECKKFFPFFSCSSCNSIVAHAKETIVKLRHMTFICMYMWNTWFPLSSLTPQHESEIHATNKL